jgi:hypothetical protein
MCSVETAYHSDPATLSHRWAAITTIIIIIKTTQ